jgi:predicted RNA binding protein YcfA (HicA-like mRNA interferase family)
MASWRDLELFLKRTGWVLLRENGKDKRFEKTLASGEILICSVSKGTGEIGKGLFARILKHQIRCDKNFFEQNK